MRHSRSEVIKRTIREFELLDDLVAGLANQDWGRLLPRPETKDPWTVKDALPILPIGRPMWPAPSVSNPDQSRSEG